MQKPAPILPPLDPASLKVRFKARCKATGSVHQNWQIRVHRAISWLAQAGNCPKEMPEARLLFLWIALNSLYSRWDNAANMPDKDGPSRRDFFYRISDNAAKATISLVLLPKVPLIRRILENPYLSEVYWRNPGDPRAKGLATQEANYVTTNLKHGNMGQILDQVVDRLYILRGQIVHGASTSGSKLNRPAITAAVELLQALVPLVIHLVIENHCGDDWPALCYAPQDQDVAKAAISA